VPSDKEKGDGAEEQQVEPDKRAVHRHDVPEQGVMTEPEDADHPEADPETDHVGDGCAQHVSRPNGRRGGHPEVDHEQGDRDGEDRVAEEQHPLEFQVPGLDHVPAVRPCEPGGPAGPSGDGPSGDGPSADGPAGIGPSGIGPVPGGDVVACH
jgi:hypothetical protein